MKASTVVPIPGAGSGIGESAADRIDDDTPRRDRAIRDFREATRNGNDPVIVAGMVRKVSETRNPKLWSTAWTRRRSFRPS